MIVGMINARAGSQGIPKKNIRPLFGKPLIQYSIEVGLSTPSIDRLIVSTDDEEIAAISSECGADVPFLRPKELATSDSLQIDTIRYNIKNLEIDGPPIKWVVLLQPTAPFRSVEDVQGCLDLMAEQNSDTVITIAEVGSRHPSGIYRMDGTNRVQPFAQIDPSGHNRQRLENIYWRTGSVYVIRRDVIMERGVIYGDRVYGHMAPEERSFNLDTMFDWHLAEAWMRYKASRSPSI